MLYTLQAGSEEDKQRFQEHVSVVERVAAGDEAAAAELYDIVMKHKSVLVRQLGSDEALDRIHDVYLDVLKAIRAGKLREPDRLVGFIRIIVRNKAAATIIERTERRDRIHTSEVSDMYDLQDRSTVSPETAAIDHQAQERAGVALSRLREIDRNVLERFYVHSETSDEVAKNLGLRKHQIHLLKSRAKRKLERHGKRAVSSGRKQLQALISEAAQAA